MNSLVAISCVPDTETRIRIDASGVSIDEREVSWMVSPFDAIALEEAVKLKESNGGMVTVVSVGSERARTGLRECLALGADKGVWVHTAGDGELDALGVAKNIAAIWHEGRFDLLWFGQKGVGWDESVVGPMTAELLGLPHVGDIVKFGHSSGFAMCEREIEGAHEHVKASVPCILTAQKGLNEPRYPSLKGIMAAKKKPILEKAPRLVQKVTNVRRLELPPPPKVCHFVPGGDAGSSADRTAKDPGEAARELVRLLSSLLK